MTDPQKDEHIEELLSKLQGIFGKLSHSEEEAVPVKPPQSPPAPAAPLYPTLDLTGSSAPATPPPPASSPTPAPVRPSAPAPAPASPPVTPSTPLPTAVYVTAIPAEDTEKMIVSTAVYFPLGRETEARAVAQKLEMITPKFTKVAFRLRVILFTPYDPKGEWKDIVLAARRQTPFRTVFVLMERPLDDVKRKGIAAELEGQDIYFQEILVSSIEKKATYMDILLGLVFFFDSHKPAAGEQAQTP